jgi:lipopolysaccharide biosynthesis glycosyltransferase
MKDSYYPILLTIDKKYLAPATVTIFSLIDNNPKLVFKIYLISEGSDPQWLIPLKEMVESKGSEAVVKCVSKAYFENIKINLHFSIATYFRLLAADLIDEEKLLYLDSDILVLGDIAPLWDLDMDRYPLAAVMDLIVRDFHRLDLVESQGYFNSGVMMMNLKVWRELDLGEKVLSYIFSNPKNIIYADQCGLNGFLKGNWLRLELKWNLQSPFFDKQYKNLFSIWSKEFNLPVSTQNPTIVHFSGNQKPWNFRSQHPYKRLYWKYLNSTPFARRFSEDLKISNLLKMLMPIGLKKYYWRHLNSKI